MGYFDMASVYSPEYKLSIYELTLELWGESGHTRDESYTNNDFDALRHRLNSKDSGLVQRLQKINIDLEPILTGTNEREKFDALRVLKLFYKTIYIEYPKVKIIKLLEKPRFGNFTVGYTRDRANYNCFMYI